MGTSFLIGLLQIFDEYFRSIAGRLLIFDVDLSIFKLIGPFNLVDLFQNSLYKGLRRSIAFKAWVLV